MYTGPHLIKDNLVFGYDTGYGIEQHSSTRHYKGEPATNLITAGVPGYFGSGGETLYRSNYYGLNSDSGVFQRNFVSNPATANTSAFNNNAGLFHSGLTFSSISANTEYILISFDFYMITPYVRHSSSGTGLNGYMRITYTDGTASSPGWNTSLNTPNAGDDWNNNSNYIGQWRKIALYVQVNSSKTPSAITHMYIYNDRTVTGEGIFTNFTITEHATAPTGPVLYTSGTRSSTESLIDLKKTRSINISGASFDSTGQPVFDGTDDGMSLGTNFNLNNKSFSVESIIKWDGGSEDTFFSYIDSAGGTQKNIHWRIYTSGQLRFDFYSNSINSSAGSIVADEYVHLVTTYNFGSDSCICYKNGEVLMAGSSGPFLGNDANSTAYVGAWGTTQRFGGEIPILKMYNSAISDSEVKQNYRAYKNRFDL